MPNITLPDGKKINFEKSISGFEVAEKISKSLSKQALLISVDGELKDLNHNISKDSSIKIFTSKDKEGLETIRHDTAHILAMAVQELFPGTQVTIGPVIEDGFYYDFARKEPFTSEDLEKIENKMREIVDRDEKTYREVWKRNDAIEHFKKKGEIYKAEIIESIPEGEEVSLYFHGDWHDLCRGPHLTSTGKIGKYFKLAEPISKAAPAVSEGIKLGADKLMMLVEKIKIFGKSADDLATQERQKVTKYEGKDGSEYELYEDLTTGDIRVEKTKPGVAVYGRGTDDAEGIEVIEDKSIFEIKKGRADETTKGKTPPDEYEEGRTVFDEDGTPADIDDVDDEVIKAIEDEIK